MSQHVLFDDSFSTLLDQACRILGEEALEKSLVHREPAGRLSFFYDGLLPMDQAEALEKALHDSLGGYVRPDDPVADRSAPRTEQAFAQKDCQWLPYRDHFVRYVDRRIVGVDWLASPSLAVATPPRFVFASLKGGVGRTTALCIAATDLAHQGKNILVIDLDLEAPGVGSLLLGEKDAPRLGAIDYLVESGVCEATELSQLVRKLVASSFVTQPEGGRVDVVPALGFATKPENYLSKLSRALLDIGPEATTLPVRAKIGRLLDELEAGQSYDAIFIDVRAGFAELAAGPLLGLGATVLLFGTAQRQTIDDYRLLFAHLASLVKPENESPWTKLRFVLAKAGPNSGQNDWFLEELYTLFQTYLYEEQEGFEGFNFRKDDRSAPHHPVPIAMNPLFSDWDPTRNPDGLTQPFYDSSFRLFVDELKKIIENRK